MKPRSFVKEKIDDTHAYPIRGMLRLQQHTPIGFGRSVHPAERAPAILFRRLKRNVQRKRFHPRLPVGQLERGDRNPLIRERMAAVYQHWTVAIAEAIEDGKADGSIKSALPAEDLAVFILDSWEGGVLRARVAKDRRVLDIFLAVGLETALA
jgi:hypothetical protein